MTRPRRFLLTSGSTSLPMHLFLPTARQRRLFPAPSFSGSTSPARCPGHHHEVLTKKADLVQRVHFLHCMRTGHFPPSILTTLYRGTIEAWPGACSAAAEKNIGSSLHHGLFKSHLGKLRPEGHTRPFLHPCSAHVRPIINKYCFWPIHKQYLEFYFEKRYVKLLLY